MKAGKPSVRLADVAEAAGVSIATASLALREDPSITRSTRKRVCEAARLLGYRQPARKTLPPIRTARSAGCRSLLYCVVDHPLGKYEYSDFLEGVMNGCQERQIRLELHRPQTGETLDPNIGREVDGVILTGVLNPQWVEHFQKVNPRLLILGNYGFPEVDSVEVDLPGVGHQMAERITNEGHRHLLHFPHDIGNYFARQLVYALRHGLAWHQVDLPPAQVDTGGPLDKALARLLKQLRQATTRREPITALSSNSAAYLEQLLAGVREAGLPIPVGYSLANDRVIDGISLLDAGWVPCGRQAVERMIQLCAGEGLSPYTNLVPPGDWLPV